MYMTLLTLVQATEVLRGFADLYLLRTHSSSNNTRDRSTDCITQFANMRLDEIFDLTAGAYFYFLCGMICVHDII